MEWFVPLVALLAILFLVGRGLPGRMHLVAVAGALAAVVLVLVLERSGIWPQSWRVR